MYTKFVQIMQTKDMISVGFNTLKNFLLLCICDEGHKHLLLIAPHTDRSVLLSSAAHFHEQLAGAELSLFTTY